MNLMNVQNVLDIIYEGRNKKMTKFKNFLKLAIPYLIAILSFIGGKYQFNEEIEIITLSLVISLLASYAILIFENEE